MQFVASQCSDHFSGLRHILTLSEQIKELSLCKELLSQRLRKPYEILRPSKSSEHDHESVRTALLSWESNIHRLPLLHG